jgi:hypothetical protein
MNTDPYQAIKIRVRFQQRRKRQVLIGVLSACLLVLVMAMRRDTALRQRYGRYVPAAAIVMLGMAGYSFWNWRCPACGKYLGRALSVRFCRNCGAKFGE